MGRACAEALLKEGVEVIINGRDTARLDEAVKELSQSTGGKVHGVVADVTTSEGRAALLAACPSPDILVNNNAGPDPRDFLTNDEAVWMGALEANMVAPMMLVRAVLPGMIEGRWMRDGLGEEGYEKVKAQFSATSLLGRVSTPEQIASAAIWWWRC